MSRTFQSPMQDLPAMRSALEALAWMGADVVKIESPSGDPGRGLRGAEGEKDREYFIVWLTPLYPTDPTLVRLSSGAGRCGTRTSGA